MNKTTLIHIFSLTVILAVSVNCAKAESAAVAHQPEKIGLEISTTASGSGGVRLKALGFEYPEMRSFETALAVKCTRDLPSTGSLSLGLNFQRTTFRMDQGAWRLPVPDRFQNTNIALSYAVQFNEKWNGMFSAASGWRNAGTTSMNSKGFGTVFTAMGLYSANPTLKFAVGAMGDTLAEGSNRFFPILGLDWQIDKKWRLALGMPRTGLFYAATDKLELGVTADANLSTYYVDKDARFAAVAGRARTAAKLEYTEARAGFQVNWQVAPSCSLSLTAGVIGYREFNYRQRNLKLKTSGVDGGYASAGLSFQF